MNWISWVLPVLIALPLVGGVLAGIITSDRVRYTLVTALAVLIAAGGIGVVYRIERLPLILAILLHGTVLYVAYLTIYLFNGWLENAVTPFIVFTACFFGGYALVWMIIYLVTRRNTDKLNARLASLNEDSAAE